MLADQRGREAEAEAAYRAAIEAGAMPAWLGLGYVLAKQPRREGEAEAAYRKAIDGGQGQGWLGLGYVLARQPGRENEAEAAYRHAIESVPGDGRAWLHLGNLLAKQPGREKDTEAAYRKAIEAGSDTATAARRRRRRIRERQLLWRVKYVAGALVFLAFLLNVVFNHVKETGPWTAVYHVNAVIYWAALIALPGALLLERHRTGAVVWRPVASRRSRDLARAGASARSIGAARRRLQVRLERRFPNAYDARHAAKGFGRGLSPLIMPLLSALILVPILSLLGALVAPLGLRPPPLTLPSIHTPHIPTPSIATPGWLQAIGDALEPLAEASKYLTPVALVTYGLYRSLQERRKRVEAKKLDRDPNSGSRARTPSRAGDRTSSGDGGQP